MARKSFVLMVVVFLLTVCGFASFIRGLNSQAVAQEREDGRGFPFTSGEKSGMGPVVSTIRPENQPPDNWTLLGTDPDEGVGINLKAVYAQIDLDILYFKVEHYRNWGSLDDLWDMVCLDTDRNSGTGMPPFTYACLGTDYVMLVGGSLGAVYRWDPVNEEFDLSNPISYAYLDAPNNANTYVVGAHLSDLENPAASYCVVLGGSSSEDWAPDCGEFAFPSSCGDVNADGAVDVGDVIYLMNYLFMGTAPPNCD